VENTETSAAQSRTSLKEAIKDAIPDDWGMVLSATAASYGIGLLALLGLPFMVGSTMDGLGLSESKAGFLGTAEFLAIMLSSIMVSPFVSRAPRRTLAFLGLVLALAGNILCVYQDQATYNSLLVFRIIAGIGCGMTLAVGNATVSNSKDPERMAAQMAVLFVTLMAITMLVFSWASEAWGYKGMYGALAICMLLVSPLLLKLPQYAIEQLPSDEHPHAHQRLLSMTSLLVLSAMFLFAMRDMSGWAFVERIGLDVGYTAGEIGFLLSIQSLVGISGPFIAAVIGARFGLKIPITIGIIGSGLVYSLMLLMTSSQLAYTVTAMFISGTYFYTLAYLTALAAELDSKGRIAAASGGFLSAGMACGPLVGGYLIEQFGYSGTSWFILGMAALTLVCALAALRAMHMKRS